MTSYATRRNAQSHKTGPSFSHGTANGAESTVLDNTTIKSISDCQEYRCPCKDRIHCLRVHQEETRKATKRIFTCSKRGPSFSHGTANGAESTVLNNTTIKSISDCKEYRCPCKNTIHCLRV